MRASVMLCLVVVGVLCFPAIALAQDRAGSEVLAAKEAEAEYLRARLARVEAEIALGRYVGQSFRQEEEQARDRVAVAAKELVRTWDRLDGATYRTPETQIAARLAEQKAEITLANERRRLWVLVHYSREKQINKLSGQLEKARELEEVKRAANERGKAGEND